MIRVVCPTCHARLRAPDEAAGRVLTCSKCRATVRVPAFDPAEAAAEPTSIAVQPWINEDPPLLLPPAPPPLDVVAREAVKVPIVRSRPRNRLSTVRRWAILVKLVALGIAATAIGTAVIVAALAALATWLYAAGELGLVLGLVSTLLGALIGRQREAAGFGAILGLLLGPLGVIVAIFVDSRPFCSLCRERIASGALKCPHCHSQLSR